MKVGFEVTEPGARGKRRRVLWLQWALLAVLAYLTLLEDPIRGLGLDHLGVIALAGVTLLISFLPIKYFAASGLDFGLLLCRHCQRKVARTEFSTDDRELGRPELTPLGKRGGAVELEIVS